MSGEDGELPVEMRRFNSLDIARPFLLRFWMYCSALFVVFLLMVWFLSSTGVLNNVNVLILIVSGVVGVKLIHQQSPLLRVPLAVNLNHPFMGEAGLGVAKVMVRLSSGAWMDAGDGRVRLIADELLGGSCLVRDDGDFAPLGHFSADRQSNTALKRYITLINQAIALRDAVNGEEDSIESAREREGADTGLLERSWFEDEESIEIEPEGLFSKFRRD